jgi:hypothetical protein
MGVKIDNNRGRMGPPKGSDEVICYSMGLISRIKELIMSPNVVTDDRAV